MPLFLENKTNTVTFRKYEYNAEALDGLLTLIKNDLLCYIVAHHPNKKFGYDVGILKTITAEAGWKEVSNLGMYDKDNPAKVFYALVPVDVYKDYITSEKYYTIKKFKQEGAIDSEKSVIKEKYELPGPAIAESTFVKNKINTPKIKLVRDTESPLYTYKTPSQKFG